MGDFEIIRRNGERVRLQSKEPFCAIESAVQNISLMGDDNVQISFVSSELIDLDKGDKIIIFGDEYTIRTKVSREMLSDRHYAYDATFYGVMYELMKSQYRNTDANGKSTKSTFDLTYSIKDFVKVLIYNVERDYPGVWKFDEENCPDTEPLTLQFSKQNCLQVLQTLCSEENFNLEFRITQADGVRTIHIGKFGEAVVPPGGNDYFEWGKGNGLYKLKEDKVDDKAVITRLWVEGGTNNIRSDYRDYSDRLQLPYPKRLNKREHTLSDGTVIAAGSEMIGIDDDTKRYFEDAELREKLGSDEDAKDYDNIYPTRTGEVTALVDGDINAFIDDTMDFDLCEKDEEGNTRWLVEGVTAKINFITGKLAGQQFELKASGGYVHSEKKFTIIAYTDERGLTIPTESNEAYRISVGDKYKITDINLPDSYIEAAEEDLWYAGLDDFLYMKQARAQYQLTLDRTYFLQSLPDDSDTAVFKVGDYVPVKDERFGIEKRIRIQKVSRNLLLEHDYSLTLSDVTSISVYSQTVLDVKEHNRIIENNRLKDLNQARKGWRTTEELRNMVYDTDGYFDPENIRPNSIDTNMLTVGSKSQQFVLLDVVLEPNVSGLGNRLNASAGVLAHLTIQEDAVRQWTMAAAEFTMSKSGGYYLYAKCSKNGSGGTWYLTQEQLKFEITEDPNNYYFQVGILSSLYEDGFRDFVTTYGFTRINGNTITTGRIVTSDGQCYLDLDGNTFRIGDTATYMEWRDGRLILKGTLLQSSSGDLSEIGVFRGTYNSGYVYYKGDEVLYTNGGETCTYRYINANPTAGNAPTNSVYWAVVAKGAEGDTGNSIFCTYNDSQNTPATPTGSGNTNGWHTESTDSVIWMSIKTAKSISDGTWGTPFRVRGADGTSITIKGTVTSISDLPTTGNENGDAYLLDGYLYIWTGTSWSNVGKIQGDAGKSSYLHMKYSDDGGKTFTDGNGETPGRWLGLYVDQIATDSDDPSKYSWSDTQGEQGIPGEPGENGKTTYLHIKYSDDGGMSFTANNGEEPGSYIGQYTDYELMDSDDPTRYTWARIKGDSGSGGTDAAAGEYYEYRYAKNGSTSVPPELDVAATEPEGWSTAMPEPGVLEYVWCTMAKKCGIVDKTQVYIPVTDSLADTSGHGYDGAIGEGTIVTDGDRQALQLTGTGDSRIPYDLPYGESFTICLWLKTDQTEIQWMFNGYNGRDYVDGTIAVTANAWNHFAFRFNNRTLSIYQNGELLQTANISEHPVGFSLYDSNMFGSTVLYDDIRILSGALPVSDIVKVMNGTADTLIQNWSTPVRINPYDGKDGRSISSVDVEYAISSSNSVAPATGWQTTAPAWEDGKYIWSRTKTTYSDATTETTAAACITGGKGATGGTGVGVESIVEQYYLSSSATSLLNGSWSTERPEWKDKWYIWTRSIITYTNGTSTTTAAICVTGSKGDTGEKGDKGDSPALVYRGEYDSNTTYYGNANRVDCVKHGSLYYVARVDAGTFSGEEPKDGSLKWNSFGSQFESVATQLLLAENANIAGWVFRNNRLESQDGNIYLDGINGKISLGGGKILLNADGSGQLANGAIEWDKDGNGELSGAFINPIGSTSSALNRTVYATNDVTSSLSIRVGSYDSSGVSSSAPIKKIGSVTIISTNTESPSKLYFPTAKIVIPNIMASKGAITSMESTYKYLILAPGAIITLDVYDDYNKGARCLRANASLGWFRYNSYIYPCSHIGASYEELNSIVTHSNAIGSTMTGGVGCTVIELPENLVKYMKLMVSGGLNSTYDDMICFQRTGGGTVNNIYTINALKTETNILNGYYTDFKAGGTFGFGIYYTGTITISSSPSLYVKLYSGNAMIAYFKITL